MSDGQEGGVDHPPQPEGGLEDAGREAAADEVVYPADLEPADADGEGSPLLVALTAEVEDARNRLLRNAADFDNYRKRVQRERDDLVVYANETLLRDLLPVLDNLERAVEAGPAPSGGDQLSEGVQMVVTQFRALLERCGVQRIIAKSMPFDPSRHEAMQQRFSDEHEPGTVIDELQRGYLFRDRLLRPSIVVVSASPVESPEPTRPPEPAPTPAPASGPPPGGDEEPVLIEVNGHYIDLSELEAEFGADEFPGEDTEPAVEVPEFFDAD